MIYFDNVSKIYNGGEPALQDITLSIQPTSGSVFFESTNIHNLNRDELNRLRRRIGMVFQDFRLIPNKTAYENIAFAMETAGRAEEEIATDVPYVLDLVDLGDKIWNFPRELSGGEQQRVAIARAIVNQPDVVIADEPTGNLDPVSTFDIVQILKKINDLGTTVLLTTHNKGVIDSLGRRVITMDGGRVVRDDKSGKYTL